MLTLQNRSAYSLAFSLALVFRFVISLIFETSRNYRNNTQNRLVAVIKL